MKGILLLGVMYLAAYLLDLTTVGYLLKAIFDNGLLVLVVIFQPEIRRALEQAGHSRKGIMRIFGGFSSVENSAQVEQWEKAIDATASAVEILQKQKMGALIVIERAHDQSWRDRPLRHSHRGGSLGRADGQYIL